MILKTTTAVKERLIAAVLEKHSYQVPEVIGLPIVLGSAAYLAWISGEVN
jgi:periplasmic divalent cation tolerance protein